MQVFAYNNINLFITKYLRYYFDLILLQTRIGNKKICWFKSYIIVKHHLTVKRFYYLCNDDSQNTSVSHYLVKTSKYSYESKMGAYEMIFNPYHDS